MTDVGLGEGLPVSDEQAQEVPGLKCGRFVGNALRDFRSKLAIGAWRRKVEIWNGIKCRVETWWNAVAEWGKTLVEDADSVRPLVCLRTACIVVTIGGIMQAEASISYVNSELAINPTDMISWTKLGFDGSVLFNPAGGASSNGLRFTAAKPSSGAMRLAMQKVNGRSELCLDTQNSTSVSIEFERAVAAAGAVVVMSSPDYATVTVRAYDANGGLILQTSEGHKAGAIETTKFMGAIASNKNIKTLEYSTDAGVISLGHVELRPFNAADTYPTDLSNYYMKALSEKALPVVSDHIYSVLKNSNFVSPEPNVLRGSIGAEGARLARSPAHAASFKLYPDGTFDYTPAKDFHGRDEFIFTGTGDYGQIQSLPGRAKIDIEWVNSAPSFSAGTDQVSEEDAGQQTVVRWATDFSAGAEDEDAVQKLTWIVNNDNPKLFADQPQVDGKGTLTYTAAEHAFGIAHLTVWLKDNGGIDNGGLDTSKPAHIVLEISPTEHKPVLEPMKDQTVLEGSTLTVQAVGSTLDYGRPIVYTMVNAPEGMTINNLTGDIKWTPGKEDAGKSYAVTINATTGRTQETTDSQIMIVNVTKLIALSHFSAPAKAMITAKAPFLISRSATMPIKLTVALPPRVTSRHRSRYWVE